MNIEDTLSIPHATWVAFAKALTPAGCELRSWDIRAEIGGGKPALLALLLAGDTGEPRTVTVDIPADILAATDILRTAREIAGETEPTAFAFSADDIRVIEDPATDIDSILNILVAAKRDEGRVEIVYCAAEAHREARHGGVVPITRVIRPYEVDFRAIKAVCELRDAPRTFRLDRIVSARALG